MEPVTVLAVSSAVSVIADVACVAAFVASVAVLAATVREQFFPALAPARARASSSRDCWSRRAWWTPSIAGRWCWRAWGFSSACRRSRSPSVSSLLCGRTWIVGPPRETRSGGRISSAASAAMSRAATGAAGYGGSAPASSRRRSSIVRMTSSGASRDAGRAGSPAGRHRRAGEHALGRARDLGGAARARARRLRRQRLPSRCRDAVAGVHRPVREHRAHVPGRRGGGPG